MLLNISAVKFKPGGHFSAGLDLQQVSQLRSEAEWPEPSTGQGPMVRDVNW